jgi:hypothetical protein
MSTSLYEKDFYAWTQQQAEALRAKDFTALDLDHLAEEMESLGISEEHAIARQLQRLLMPLLKWTYQPSQRTPSWDTSIDDARQVISDVIERSPRVQSVPTAGLPRAFARARRQAAKETGFPLRTFPEVCPWSLDEMLTDDWYPEAP